MEEFPKDVVAATFGGMIYNTCPATNMKILRNINVNTSSIIPLIRREIRERINTTYSSKRSH